MRPSLVGWIAGIALLGHGCTPAPAPVDLGVVASRYIQLTRELSQHDPSLIDHWIAGPPDGMLGPRRPVSTLHLAADVLVSELTSTAVETSGLERFRAEWLLGQARALRLAAGRLMGESLPFDTEARLAFGISPSRADRFAADRALETLDEVLPGEGTRDERLAAFRRRFEVPPAARERVMTAALDACREAARADLPLPPDETVDVTVIDGLPWDAHARYVGLHRTRIELNGGPAFDLSRALRLACHEGYAGHHVQHIWAADELVGRLGWTEHGLVPGFGPALLLAEGAADAGTALAMPPVRRARIYGGTLAPAAGLRLAGEDLERLVRVEEALAALEPLVVDIAREYLDNRINAATAAERLTTEALVAEAEAFVFFIERRRTRILAYTEGRRLAREHLAGSGLAGLRGLFVPAIP